MGFARKDVEATKRCEKKFVRYQEGAEKYSLGLTKFQALDLSTDDVITPAAIRYSYPLMFEERSIELMTYTPETLLCGRYKMDCSLRSCMRLHKE